MSSSPSSAPQVTGTGIAVALAVVVALGLLFFGPRVFAPFSPTATAPVATTTNQVSSTTAVTAPSSMQAIPNPLPTTLTITDEVVGTGKAAAVGNTVSVDYVGMLPDGTVFDASKPRGEAFSFTIGEGRVIKGWEQGLVGMKEGGKRRLIIPADLAYGAQGAGGVIPPNATLVFDIELLKVQ